MALQAVYKQFLAAPNSSLLASDAALHYVTTTTSYRGATDIIKHLAALRNQVKKKKEEFLTVIEGQNAAAIEVDTSLEFVTSGAAYLPGLDDNFLADRTVILPITHIVTFNAEGKVQQIRQSWDQASLLKQLDIIGKSGRNWPIRDAKEQIKLIESSWKASSEVAVASDSGLGPAARARGSSNDGPRDPRSSLALFAPREEIEQQTLESVVSPKGGARPRQRDFTEILGDEPVHDPNSPSSGRNRSESPHKAFAPKSGAGKNFQANRLFDTEGDIADEPEAPEGNSPDRFYRPNPNKYNHFDFADGSDPQDAPQAADPTSKKTKHNSQWNFEDFTTPAKARPGKTLQKGHQDVRHWGNENDEVEQTPIRKPAIVKPRRDAETHFDFVDDGLPKGEPRANRPRGATHNNGLGLYKNNVYSEEEEADDPAAAVQDALGNVTNLKSRGKTFESHFSMADKSPAQVQEKHHVAQDRQKAVKMMDANWSSYDKSPAQKENQPVKPRASGKPSDNQGIHIGGDGMGGSKGTNRDWLFGGDDDELPKNLPGRKQNAAKPGGFDWDF
ncbi:hypothetical protein BKA67DRAFT_105622 [Truncatella angustata]|uniref:NTF2-like protein n=1 Tax=Truncatella angustata TaxID=152316 RepID=A0A9P8RN45_9PEZI|nr:uncharacterized protein BKA67DRAFT_105622 [Truncatella angustata]KAH6646485.1 hypothetical protein BKA67DRAFT_105622 [Truncatella angustata]KAH8199035.1 hypothetical protein TruAng_006773 [Truncatella angustata]